jgi:hypothetical protein
MNKLNSLTLITYIYGLVFCFFLTQNNTDKSEGEVNLQQVNGRVCVRLRWMLHQSDPGLCLQHLYEVIQNYIVFKTTTTFRNSLWSKKRDYLLLDVRSFVFLSVCLSACYLLPATKPLLGFHEIRYRSSLKMFLRKHEFREGRLL